MDLQPYLFFEGRTEEAIEFYKRAVGAKVEMMMRFKESPDQTACPVGAGMENKVMHATLHIGNTMVFASDGQCQGKASFQGFALSISVASEAEAKRVFSALEDGGQVQLPLTKTFFSPCFGMLSDRFGVAWMVIVPQQ
jgi:PhnB protein